MKPQKLSHLLILIIAIALLRNARAVVPPPDGGYPNFTTAEGTNALQNLTTGAGNTGVGWYSLFSDTTASFNTAVGVGTLLFNNANENTAIGAATLLFNTAGGNTAIGSRALLNNTTGGTLGNIQGIDFGPNVAVGQQALESNTVASANTAVGYQALHSFTTGPVGFEQLGLSTAVGFQVLANATGAGAGNSGFGYQALRNDTEGSDPAGTSQFGLLAEDVERVNPDLIVRDKDGKPYSVRYDQVNAMLLNEFLKEHRKGEEQDLAISQLKSALAQQQKKFESKLGQQEQQIAQLIANLQRLAADIEVNNAGSQAVANK
jgi:hypothetical protein